ncbi:MAG: lipoyl synthase [Desulfuromonadales bacterium]|nr:lipoyl synthase [Desulfuromonadales bacterium]
MATEQPRKPDWLKVRFTAGPNFSRIDRYHRQQGLHSVCRSAACPNQGECWSKGTATFMILGDICSRNCRFCNVGHAAPQPPDPQEPARVARAVVELGLKHAVITSVTRDDLADGGATQFAELTRAIHQRAPDCRIELLIPDLQGDQQSLAIILTANPLILGHNLETVPRLYPLVRLGAEYRRSLQLLARAKEMAPQVVRKSGLMLGMGEDKDEVLRTLNDLREVDCQILTLGQYLAPSRDHFPVERYLHPDEFSELRQYGLDLGFSHVEAGPLVRSSYHAEEQFDAGLPGHGS